MIDLKAFLKYCHSYFFRKIMSLGNSHQYITKTLPRSLACHIYWRYLTAKSIPQSVMNHS